MAKICDVTGKHTRSGNNSSNANNKTKRKFYANLHDQRFYIPKSKTWIRLRVAASTMRTISKKGILPVLKQAHKQGTLNPYLRNFVAVL